MERFGMFNSDLLKNNLTSRQKTILLALIYHANENSECHPSRKALAELTGYDPDRISNITSSLEKTGWIEKSDGRGKGYCSYRILKGHRIPSQTGQVSSIKPSQTGQVIPSQSGQVSSTKPSQSGQVTPPNGESIPSQSGQVKPSHFGQVKPSQTGQVPIRMNREGTDKEQKEDIKSDDLIPRQGVGHHQSDDENETLDEAISSPAEPDETVRQREDRIRREREKASIHDGKTKQDDTALREWKPNWQMVGLIKKQNDKWTTDQIIQETESWRAYMFAIRSDEDDPEKLNSCKRSWIGWMRKATPKVEPTKRVKYYIPEKPLSPEEHAKDREEVEEFFRTNPYLQKCIAESQKRLNGHKREDMF